MKLENQVVSLELAKRLKELGVKQESLFSWCQSAFTPEKWSVCLGGFNGPSWQDYGGPEGEEVAAFTTSELGEMLPEMTSWKFDGKKCCSSCAGHTESGRAYTVKQEGKDGHQEFAETEADARAKMLIYLTEKKP